jgi:hypothetical protein
MYIFCSQHRVLCFLYTFVTSIRISVFCIIFGSQSMENNVKARPSSHWEPNLGDNSMFNNIRARGFKVQQYGYQTSLIVYKQTVKRM